LIPENADADQAGNRGASGAAERAGTLILPHLSIALASGIAAPAVDADKGARCRGVALEYDIARAEVQEAAAGYQKCLADDQSASACTEAFAELDLAQDRFEHAAEERRACTQRQ
jgi:hypothetical protein